MYRNPCRVKCYVITVVNMSAFVFLDVEENIIAPWYFVRASALTDRPLLMDEIGSGYMICGTATGPCVCT